MDRPRTALLAALLLAALVLLSGCSLLGNDDPTVTPVPTATPDVTGGPPPVTTTTTVGSAVSPTPSRTPVSTVTPSSTPTSTSTSIPTPTRTADLDPLSAMDSPPGVTASAVDVETLLAAHREQLSGGPHRAQYTVVATDRTDEAVLVVDDASALSVRIDDNGTPGSLAFYVSDRELASRNTTTGEVLYGAGPLPTREFVLSLLDSVRKVPDQYAALAEWEAVGVATADGRQRAVLEPTGVATTPGSSTGAVTDLSGRMLVTSAGRIANLTLRVTVEGANGSTETRGIEYTTDRYGSATVERPAWVSAPPTLRPRVQDGGLLLRYRHTGGATVPAGTQVNVTSGLSRVGAATVDQPVEPGDVVYVYRTGNETVEGAGERTDAGADNGTDARVHVAVGERPVLPENATTFDGVVTLEGWAGDYQFQSAVDVNATGSTPAQYQ